MQHAARAGGQRRRVAAALEPLPGRLDADQLDLLVVHERRERADGVRAAAHAGDHAVGQPALGRPGPARASRRRSPAGGRAPAPGRAPGRPPSRSRSGWSATLATQSRIAALTASLSVRAPASTGAHLGAEQPHPLHVGALAAHVLGAHVDHALEVQQRARGGGGHAVLAGAGLGDHPALAHPPGQQRLAERVVDLVRAGVQQVLALEVDRRSPAASDSRRREVERRRAARVVAQQRVQLRARTPGRRAPRARPPRARRAPGSASRARSGRRRGRTRARCSSPPGALTRARAPARRRPPRGRTRSACAGSLRPGAASVPLALSTANGRDRCDRLAHVVGREPAGEHQRHVRRGGPGELPARRSRPCRRACPGTWASSRWKSVWNGSSVAHRGGVLHAHRLHHLGSRCGARPRGSRRGPRRRAAAAG